MTFDQWIASSQAEAVRLRVATDRPNEPRVSGADALLHVPLLAFTLLALAQHLRGDLRTAEISPWAAAVLSERAFGARQAFQRYAWSLELRTRCSDALVFLEGTALVQVAGEDPARRVTLTQRGREFIATTRRAVRASELFDELSRACAAAQARGVTLL
jgi:hypothetical protein